MGLDLVVVAMDCQHRTADPAIHQLGDIERRHDGARFNCLDQHRAIGVAGPGDAFLDLPRRVRLGEDVPDEMLGEVGIVGQPVRAIVFVPAHWLPIGALLPGHEMLLRHVLVGGPDDRRRTGQDGSLHPFRMVRGQHAGEQAAEGEADHDGLAGIGGVHDRQRIGHAVRQRVGGDIVGPVGPSVAAGVEGDAAEALAEIGQLRLVDARMHDAPGRQEDHRLPALPVDLVVDADAVAFDEPVLTGQLRAHHVILVDDLASAMRMASPTLRSAWRTGEPFFSSPSR